MSTYILKIQFIACNAAINQALIYIYLLLYMKPEPFR